MRENLGVLEAVGVVVVRKFKNWAALVPVPASCRVRRSFPSIPIAIAASHSYDPSPRVRSNSITLATVCKEDRVGVGAEVELDCVEVLL
jgi:hypothetical protein